MTGDNHTPYLNRQTDAAPLALFRILFGGLMFLSLVRFAANGWIEALYLQPEFFFSYLGFEWVKPLGNYTYGLFAICGLSSLCVAAGYKYRLAVLTFFLSFTYIELMDKTNYLNHYYFLSVLSFLMIFLPANVYFSVDARRNPGLRTRTVPRWSIDAVKLLISVVYIFAGLAKLNSDWLVSAMPLQIWLPSKYAIPILGDLLQLPWVHYFFSWSGALFDLSIPFLLFFRATRIPAFLLVVMFHLLTGLLFPIGMFPYIMIASALIFFDPGFHHRILEKLAYLLRINKKRFDDSATHTCRSAAWGKISLASIALLLLVQVCVPFRYLLYPGELFWTEEGYRFSWRVMLMEKTGYAQFKIVDPETGRQQYVDNSIFLTPLQEKQMATQPDFILEYAHFLDKQYSKTGINDPEIYVESYVALNGRPSQPYIDPDIDLSSVDASLRHKNWILPFNDTIHGF